MTEEKKPDRQEIEPDSVEVEGELVRGSLHFPSTTQYITPEQVRAIDKQVLNDFDELLHYLSARSITFDEYRERMKDPDQKEVLNAASLMTSPVDALIALYKEDLFLVDVDPITNEKRETGIRYVGGDQVLQKKDFYGNDPFNTMLMDHEQLAAMRDYLLITENGDYFAADARHFEITNIRKDIEYFAEVMAKHPQVGEKHDYSAEDVQAICDALQQALPALPVRDKVIDTEGTVVLEGKPELPPKTPENKR